MTKDCTWEKGFQEGMESAVEIIEEKDKRIAELKKVLKQIASHDDSEYCMSSVRNIARSALLREEE